MFKNYIFKLLFVLVLHCSTSVFSQTLLHYWNFNNNSSVANLTSPNVSLISGCALNAIAGGISTIDASGGTGQNFNLQNLNARNGDVSGSHLRFNDPIGGALQFNIPTTGYQNIIIKFATRRSSSGAGIQQWAYSINGTDFIDYISITPNNGDPALASLDFSTISGANNNPNFKLKVTFSQGLGGTVGNNRFDNFTVEGQPSSGLDNLAPIPTFNPAPLASNVATSIQPTISFNENVRLLNDSAINSTNVDALVELRLNNASGNLIPFDATFDNNVITIIPNSILSNNQTYCIALLANSVEDESNNAISTLQSSSFTTANTSISLASNFVTTQESDGTINLVLNITNPATSSIDIIVKTAPFSTADANDLSISTQTINLNNSSGSTLNIPITIIDDTIAEQHAEYVVISLENPIGLTVSGIPNSTIYIIDNDSQAPIASEQIELNYLGSFDPSGSNTSTCEIVVHDPATQRLFTTSAVAGYLDIINFSNPASPTLISSINMNVYGGVTSVAVKNGIVAVASPNADETQAGSVVFFNTNGVFLKQVTVGALPDMITFSPDGTKVLTANEGQPNTDYSIDPEGSISIIDISNGITGISQSQVTTLNFTSYNAVETPLLASGVRKIKSTSTLSQDLEPEYITISADSQKAWVTLQENNAIAEINLTNNTISDIWALGTKDISLPGNGFDVSDNNGQILIANWPMQAYYIPDALANYTINGTTYIVTANEGDEKEYGSFTERTTVGASTYNLDTFIFPQASILKQNHNLGRFRVTNINGNLDADTAYESVFCLGSRSFSIFNTNTKQIVFDSGDDFERYTATQYPSLFNSDHESNSLKNRSRAKGPEPEGITLANIGGQTFAFISLERVGGVMVYNITDPDNVTFVDYKNSRNTSAYGGDNGPEGITYISATNSPTGIPYILIANEISGTITIFEVATNTLDVPNFTSQEATFNLFPNPTESNGVVYFNRPSDIQIFDFTGKLILEEKNALTINTKNWAKGIYLVKNSKKQIQKLIVK